MVNNTDQNQGVNLRPVGTNVTHQHLKRMQNALMQEYQVPTLRALHNTPWS